MLICVGMTDFVITSHRETSPKISGCNPQVKTCPPRWAWGVETSELSGGLITSDFMISWGAAPGTGHFLLNIFTSVRQAFIGSSDLLLHIPASQSPRVEWLNLSVEWCVVEFGTHTHTQALFCQRLVNSWLWSSLTSGGASVVFVWYVNRAMFSLPRLCSSGSKLANKIGGQCLGQSS